MYNKQATMPTLARNIEATKIDFSPELKVLPNNMQVINYRYDNGKTLEIQAPEMFVPFPVSDYNQDGKFNINLSLDTTDEKNSIKKARRIEEFKIAMQSVNDTLIDLVHKNQKVWFKWKKNKTREQLVEDHFSNPIKFGKERSDGTGNYTDLFRVSVKPDKLSIVTKNGGTLEFDELVKESMYDCVCIFKITGAWVSPSLKKFGWFTRCSLIRVSPSTRTPIEFQTYDSDTESDIDSM